MAKEKENKNDKKNKIGTKRKNKENSGDPNGNNRRFDPFNFDPFDIEKLIKNFMNFKEFNSDINDSIMKFNSKNHNNPKGYSISYKFGTGMKKPEIKINGEPMDEEQIDNLFDMIKNLPIDKMGFPMMPFDEMDEENLFNLFNMPGFENNIFGIPNQFGPHNQFGQPIVLDAEKLTPEHNEINLNTDNENDLKAKNKKPNSGVNKVNINAMNESILPKEIPFSEIVVDENENKAEITIEMPTVSKENINISIFGKKVIISGESKAHWFEKSFDLEFKPDPNKTEIEGRNGIYIVYLKS